MQQRGPANQLHTIRSQPHPSSNSMRRVRHAHRVPKREVRLRIHHICERLAYLVDPASLQLMPPAAIHIEYGLPRIILAIGRQTVGPQRPAPMQRHNHANQLRIEPRPTAFHKRRHRRLNTTPGRKNIQMLRHSADTRQQRNLLPFQTVRIPIAIPMLIEAAHRFGGISAQSEFRNNAGPTIAPQTNDLFVVHILRHAISDDPRNPVDLAHSSRVAAPPYILQQQRKVEAAPLALRQLDLVRDPHPQQTASQGMAPHRALSQIKGKG